LLVRTAFPLMHQPPENLILRSEAEGLASRRMATGEIAALRPILPPSLFELRRTGRDARRSLGEGRLLRMTWNKWGRTNVLGSGDHRGYWRNGMTATCAPRRARRSNPAAGPRASVTLRTSFSLENCPLFPCLINNGTPLRCEPCGSRNGVGREATLAEQSQREKRSDFSDGNTRIARSPSCETRPAGAPQDEVEQVEWSKDRARSDRNELLLVVRSVAQRRVSNHGPRLNRFTSSQDEGGATAPNSPRSSSCTGRAAPRPTWRNWCRPRCPPSPSRRPGRCP